tara:strand:+ start:287 stop:688 length:402 start_codon:yes stop_codon:yes gene_type:complete
LTSQNNHISNFFAPVSLGEIVDKITILEIKKKHMIGKKLKNVDKELKLLQMIIEKNNIKIDLNLINRLKDVNNNIWGIEDRIRIKERIQVFDQEFIQLARSVYIENDKRASIKKDINRKYNSELIEEKSYEDY